MLAAGAELWQADVEAQVFSALSTLPAVRLGHSCQLAVPSANQPAMNSAQGAVDDSVQHSRLSGICRQATTAGQDPGVDTSAAVAVADMHGQLHLLCTSCGAKLWADALPFRTPADDVGEGERDAASAAQPQRTALTGAGPVLEIESLLFATRAGTDNEVSHKHEWAASAPRPLNSIVWVSNAGTVGVLRLPPGGAATASSVASAEQQLSAADSGGMSANVRLVQMPADSFSAPVAFNKFAVLGCRDDHLYCLEWP